MRTRPNDDRSQGMSMLLLTSSVGQALVACGTSNQWSMLSSVMTKMNKKLDSENRIIDPRRLVEFLKSIGAKELNAHGVWWTSFGSQYEPIILVNPAYARARALERSGGSGGVCTCCGGSGADDTTSSSSSSSSEAAARKSEAASKKYFESHDYNAGRHASTASCHIASCCKWKPPTTSHLHSWRRGFAGGKI